MDSIEQIDNLIGQLKKLNFGGIRSYSTDNKNIANICFIDSIKNIEQTQKVSEIKSTYSSLLAQHYSHQIGIRGDGNCFYRSVMLMNIVQLASTEDTLELEKFIATISNLQDIRLDYTNYIIHTEDLQLIFIVFLKKILTWRRQMLRVDLTMIINEYNSLPEVDFAACAITRFMIYQTFKLYQKHPQIQAFVDDEIKQNIPKILLKHNEYAEGIIIPLTSQVN